MRHVVAMLVVASLLSGAAQCAEDVKPSGTPPVPAGSGTAPPAAERLEKWEPSENWIAAIERLRSFPRPGEIVNAGVTAGAADIVKVSPAEEASIDKLVAEYDAAALQKAAKWEDELKALRADYEAKVVAAFPEAKRDTAKKLLDLSHAKWVTPTERDVKFKKEFIEREKAFKLATRNKPPEETTEAREEIKTWIHDERAKMAKEDEETIAALKALLTPEEVERLERFNRHRPVPTPPPTPAPPQPKK